MADMDDPNNPGNTLGIGDPRQQIIELLLERRRRVSEDDPLTAAEKDKIRHIIVELKLEHRDLDAAIARMTEGVYMDELQLRRMKKRKLYLKDIIARLGSSLIPDMDA